MTTPADMTTKLANALATIEQLEDLLRLHVMHLSKLEATHTPRLGVAPNSNVFVVTTPHRICEQGAACWHCGSKNLSEETKAALDKLSDDRTTGAL